MSSEDLHIGIQVQAREGYREPYPRGRDDTIIRRYGCPGYVAFEVRFAGGDSEMIWDHELEESEEPSSAVARAGRLSQFRALVRRSKHRLPA